LIRSHTLSLSLFHTLSQLRRQKEKEEREKQVKEIVEMGYDYKKAKKALEMTGYKDLNQAVSWLLENENYNFDEEERAEESEDKDKDKEKEKSEDITKEKQGIVALLRFLLPQFLCSSVKTHINPQWI
jgi:uncharacterized UBP type Zn finger protein